MFAGRGEDNLLRNLDGTAGLPRGAKDGLGLGEDETFPFSSEDHASAVSPSPGDDV